MPEISEWKGWLNNKKHCVMIYLLVAIPTMSALIIGFAPFQNPDEARHLYRAIQISEGQLLPKVAPGNDSAGDYLDSSIVKLGGFYEAASWDRRFDKSFGLSTKDREDSWHLVLSGDKHIFVNFSNTAVYFPLAYVVPSVAVVVTRQFSSRPLIWMYVARIASMLTAAIVVCIALWIGEDFRPMLLVFALLPRVLVCCCAVSADSLLLPTVLIYTVLLYRLYTNLMLGGGAWIMLTISTIFICVNKIAYLPLALLAPAIALFTAKMGYSTRIWAIVSSTVVIAIWILWAAMIRNSVFTIRLDSDITIDIYRQLAYVMHNPLGFIRVLGHTLRLDALYYLNTMVGGQLGSYSANFPKVVSFGSLVLLGLSITVFRRSHPWSPTPLVLPVISCAAASVAVFLLLYMQFTPLHASYIDGIQGRYFLPLIPVLGAFSPQWQVNNSLTRIFAAVVPPWLGMSSVLAVTLVAMHYWKTDVPSATRFVDFQPNRYQVSK